VARNTKEREQFMLAAGRHGLTEHTARALLRVSSTLTRLAEAQCNGDWPADNGDKDRQHQCAQCLSGWHRSAIRKDGRCIDCHATDRAKALAPEGWTVRVQGDPRGYVLRLVNAEGREIGVP